MFYKKKALRQLDIVEKQITVIEYAKCGIAVPNTNTHGDKRLTVLQNALVSRLK